MQSAFNRVVVAAFVSGLLFAFGVSFSGMTRPSKVLGFLDVTAAWDPSLAFVMAGALLVYMPLYHLIKRRARPLFETRFHLPEAKGIDKRLLCGATIFGIGWGLAGFCPGPAMASLGTFTLPAAVFCLCMFIGMYVGQLINKRSSTP